MPISYASIGADSEYSAHFYHHSGVLLRHKHIQVMKPTPMEKNKLAAGDMLLSAMEAPRHPSYTPCAPGSRAEHAEMGRELEELPSGIKNLHLTSSPS